MLIKCPECEKMISDKAIKCTYCGYPLKEVKKDNKEENKDERHVIME